jgi:hypothetical protein
MTPGYKLVPVPSIVARGDLARVPPLRAAFAALRSG